MCCVEGTDTHKESDLVGTRDGYGVGLARGLVESIIVVVVVVVYTYREMTSHNLWSRYDHHFVGVTWHNVWS